MQSLASLMSMTATDGVPNLDDDEEFQHTTTEKISEITNEFSEWLQNNEDNFFDEKQNDSEG